jgi:hypothetical protein
MTDMKSRHMSTMLGDSFLSGIRDPGSGIRDPGFGMTRHSLLKAGKCSCTSQLLQLARQPLVQLRDRQLTSASSSRACNSAAISGALSAASNFQVGCWRRRCQAAMRERVFIAAQRAGKARPRRTSAGWDATVGLSSHASRISIFPRRFQ